MYSYNYLRFNDHELAFTVRHLIFDNIRVNSDAECIGIGLCFSVV